MVVIAIYAWVEGDPSKFLSPIDDDGHFCGHDSGYEDYDKLYFPDLTSVTSVESKYVCIKGSCPDADSGTIDCKETDGLSKTCNDGSFIRYDTDEYLGRL